MSGRAPTARRAWLMPFVRRYVDFRLARAFEGVFVAGLDEARAALADGPAVIAANHVAWWDPLLATALDARLSCEGFALMDAESLSRLWFFGAIGALPLRRDSARAARADLAAAATRLCGPRRALWIFPQGKQRPSHLRPLGLAGGVAWLAEHTRAVTLPLSISYLYREAPEPAIFATFGAPLRFTSRRAFLGDLERALELGLDRNDAAATGSQPSAAGPEPVIALDSAPAFASLWPLPLRPAVPLAGRLLAGARHAPAPPPRGNRRLVGRGER